MIRPTDSLVDVPADAGAELHRVRVPIVFDHLNAELRAQFLDRKVEFMQSIGRGVALMGDESLNSGKVEVWFELNCAPTAAGRHLAAGHAISIVEEALERVDLAPTGDETGLSVVRTQVITTQLTGAGAIDE